MLPDFSTIDKSKAVTCRFERIYYADKPEELKKFIDEARKHYEIVIVEHYNGNTIPYDMVVLDKPLSKGVAA